MKIDPTKTWQAVEAAFEAETNPLHKQLLGLVCEHMKTEVCGELDPLMDTLTTEPVYHTYGMGALAFGPKSRDEVRAFYEGLIASGGNLFEFNVERIITGDGGVITEGTLRNAYGGDVIAAAGITEIDGEPVDPSAKYVSEVHLLTVWPNGGDGKLLGEDIFFGANPFDNLKKLAPGEEPVQPSIADV